ncbi:MAG: type II toxin-antitoxin system HigB family toxin [Proteobacteria bacterium]|nr:type II toxin-antitoxin system HigB family toxin [Pseudomonadota bacterium]
MRITAKRTLRLYWERERGAEQPLRSWFAIASKADSASPREIKAVYRSASTVGGDRVVSQNSRTLGARDNSLSHPEVAAPRPVIPTTDCEESPSPSGSVSPRHEGPVSSR